MTSEPLGMDRAHRLKRCIQVLVILLILDVMFILYMIPPSHFPSIKFLRTSSDSITSRMSRVRSGYPTDKPTNFSLMWSYINPMDLDRYKFTLRKVMNTTGRLNSSEPLANPLRPIVLLKTHKTGSSTLQNIILRHAMLHDQKIALPIWKASFYWPQKFMSQSVKMSNPNEKFDVFAHHAVLVKPTVDLLMNDHPLYVTILREPVSLFRSAYSYYNYNSYCFQRPINLFTKSIMYETALRGVCKPYNVPVRNILAFDLGLPFTSMDNQMAIELFIRSVDETFELVLLMERFDESMILLKKFMGWKMSDIAYFKLNAQLKPRQSAIFEDPKLNENIRQFNNVDVELYDHFSKKFDEVMDQHFTKEERLQEIMELNRMISSIKQRCILKEAGRASLMATNNSAFVPYGAALGYLLRPESQNDIQCRLMALPEVQLTHFLKAYQERNVQEV